MYMNDVERLAAKYYAKQYAAHLKGKYADVAGSILFWDTKDEYNIALEWAQFVIDNRD